uniref:Uncharacterized protein n=1 Tax=Calcidiscus leptoporus TaxID=127549 RepID=A0A7S0NW59_9EUKA|mmetsp:Transcript_3290/g.7434  ORF Transcript_3290/g.7434 Transcript_3290/m.7434 type:complete len:103 (+) Transcript_3290:407-715(+)
MIDAGKLSPPKHSTSTSSERKVGALSTFSLWASLVHSPGDAVLPSSPTFGKWDATARRALGCVWLPLKEDSVVPSSLLCHRNTSDVLDLLRHGVRIAPSVNS